MNVKFCPACRNLILAAFRYCPYCGIPANRGPGLEEAVGESFVRLAARSEEGRTEGRFVDLAARLDRLEDEMELILSELVDRGGGPRG